MGRTMIKETVRALFNFDTEMKNKIQILALTIASRSSVKSLCY